MAGLEGLVNPVSTEGTKSVDGKKVSVDGVSIPKEGPSLFDSMMSQLSSKSTGTSEGEAEATSENSKQTGTQNLATPVKGAKTTGENKASTSNTLAQGSSTSLFDKMVTGAKENQSGVTTTQTTAQNNSTTLGATTTNTLGVSTASTQVTPQNQVLQTAETKVATVDGTKVVDTNTPAGTTVQKANGKTTENLSGQNKTTVNNETQVATNQGPKVGKHKNIKQVDTATNEAQTQTTVSKKKTASAPTKQDSIVNSQNTQVTQNTSDTKVQKATNVNGKVVKNETSDTSTLNVQTQKVQSTDSNTDKVATVATASGVASKNVPVEKTANTNNTAVKTTIKDTSVSKGENTTATKTNVAKSTTPNKSLSSNSTSSIPAEQVVDNKSKTSTIDTKVASTTSPETKSTSVDTTNPNTIKQQNKQDTKISKTDADEGVKKSLADNLISTATATALASKGLEESAESGSKVVNNGKQTQTTSIAQSNTPVNLSSGEGTQATTQNLVDTSSSQDVKTIDQNVVDKKVETKNIDIKTADQKQQIIKSEKDHTLKTATAGTLATSSATSKNTTAPTNEELASGLANIRDIAKGDVSIVNDSSVKSSLSKENLKKEDTLLGDKKQQNSNSLLDKMMKDSTTASTAEKSAGAETLGAKDQFVQKDLPLFATAGYLHDQKKRNDIANMMKKNEGVLQAQNAKNVSDVKSSAQTLGLNASEAEVIEEVVQKEEVRVQNTRDDVLKRMAFDNNVGKKLHNNTHQLKANENIVAKAAQMTNTTEEQVVEVAVSAEATQTIENRIIGARQSLRTMMSDVARQMAQNYRAPLTAFRINLNPSGLGNIAVMIKSEQSNGISISLNMSNTNTLDTFVDNQSQLRAALTRNFDNNTNFNLDFGMQQDRNSNQNQNNESNQNSNSSANNTETESNIVAEQHTTEEVISQANYM